MRPELKSKEESLYEYRNKFLEYSTEAAKDQFALTTLPLSEHDAKHLHDRLKAKVKLAEEYLHSAGCLAQEMIGGSDV